MFSLGDFLGEESIITFQSSRTGPNLSGTAIKSKMKIKGAKQHH
jgi:hypothetical protein